MSSKLTQEFGVFRSMFWPIYSHETRKILPMFLIMFLICLNYSVLRNMKDAVVIAGSGAKVLPFIKVWALLPMAIILTFVFTKLSNRYSQEKVFYIIISGFLIFYAIFGFILYPLRDVIHDHNMALSLEAAYPGFVGPIRMLCYWSFTLFYVFAELWSSIVMHVLFWGFANEITRIYEASRFYGTLNVASNLSAIFAGQIGNYFCMNGVFNPNLPFGKTAYEQTEMISISLVIASGIAVMLIFRWMNNNVLNDPSFDEFHRSKREIKKKRKMSLSESLSFLSNSKYLACIAVIVVSYNLAINLVEMIWKDQLDQLYPNNPTAINHYMNTLTSMIGGISLVTALFLPRIIDRLGWAGTAMITPFTILVTGAGFFSFMIFQDALSGVAYSLVGLSPLALVVFFGGAQNCLTKAAKYSVFDATKEMAFIPLEHQTKLKGKAAIDGVGSRFGKAGGSFLHQGLLVIFGSYAMSAPVVALILLVAIFFWFSAVRTLGLQFNEISEGQQEPQEESSTSDNSEPVLNPA